MNWFRYVFLALILVCAVSLLSLLAPDSKSSDRRFRIYRIGRCRGCDHLRSVSGSSSDKY